MQRTAKLYDDDGHGEHVGLRLLLLVAVSMTARALSPQTNRRRMTKKRGTGRKILAALRRVTMQSLSLIHI